MDSKLEFQVSGGALIFLAALVLLFPLQWVGAVVVAAVVHELCHAFAIYLLGGSIECIAIDSRGIVMKTQPMSGIREIVCALAGPLGSLCLLLFVRNMPRTSVCGLIHGLFNLIPLLPMDGGRVLRGILYGLLTPPKAEKLLRWIQYIMYMILTLCCLMLISKAGIFALIIGITLLRNAKMENLLAKMPFWRYNRRTMDSEVRL